MSIVRRFPVRKISYYTAIKLYSVFGEKGNKPFTNVDACYATGKWVCGGLFALRNTGIIEQLDGKKRAVGKHRNEQPTKWRFTTRSLDYMQTPSGREEYETELAYLEKISDNTAGEPVCA